MAFSSATHDVAADGFYMLALNENQQSFYVGLRSTFYRISTIVTQGGLLFCVSYLQENLQLSTYDSWEWIFIAVAGLFLLLMLYHKFVLPCPTDDGTNEKSRYHFLEGYFKVFIEFFKKESIVISILFLLLYRLPEALLVKICPLFFLDEVANGGLGLTKGELGFIQGTIGVIGLLIGGILGGWMVSKYGLKKSLWPMVFAISIPDALYLIMAYFQNASLLFVAASVFVEQLGYGFGFTAYMLYMIYISQGKYKTAYYAFCTGFMALSMMLPGLFAGWLQENLGYKDFFTLVCVLTSFTFLSAMIIKLDRDFGKEK
jgi:PAT family beta-lactamase induction signal transducer AmpG